MIKCWKKREKEKEKRRCEKEKKKAKGERDKRTGKGKKKRKIKAFVCAWFGFLAWGGCLVSAVLDVESECLSSNTFFLATDFEYNLCVLFIHCLPLLLAPGHPLTC